MSQLPKLVVAYTPAPDEYEGYVPYINISHHAEADAYRVTVRTGGTEAPTAHIDLAPFEMASILTKMLFEMDDKLFELIDVDVLKRVAGPRG